MRNAFAKIITELAKADPRIVLLSGDIGNKLFDPFKEVANERFFNCGVSEAHMISMAAGLAASGFIPVAYTITPFITYRCFEQIRVDLCYHNQHVIIVGVGSGMGYASLGATHHSCEDIAIMRSLPGMSVVCPGDPNEVLGAVPAAINASGPVYLRIGKKGEPKIHPLVPEFTIGKGITLSSGEDVCILASGTILDEAVKVSRLLNAADITTTLVSLHTVKPLDQALLRDIATKHKLIVTLEEHSLVGGLGSSILEFYNNEQKAPRVLRIGCPDEFFHEAGEREHAFERWGLTVENIVKKIKIMLHNLM